MNQKNNIHSVIIGLLVVGLLLSGGGIYLLSMQIKELKRTVAPAVSQTTTTKSHFEDYNGTGIAFDYPKGWFVEEYGYGDSDVPGMKNAVRLTSSSGALESAESSGGPICATQQCFKKGLQMDLRPASAELVRELRSPTTELSLGRTLYHNISSIDGCDGAGCPNQWFLLERPNGDLEIRIVYTDSSYAAEVNSILESFVLGWQ